jgi:hypothetical protein
VQNVNNIFYGTCKDKFYSEFFVKVNAETVVEMNFPE